jgi:hypothetical protein
MTDPKNTPAPNEITPGPGIPAPHVAGVPKPDEKPAGEPAAPYATFPTAEAFQERLAREARKHAAELIGLAPEEAKKKLEKLAKLEAEEEERKKASMSEVERAKTDAETAKSEAAAAKAEAEAARASAENARAMAKLGVTNEGYAEYLLETARKAAKAAGTAFDASAELAKLLEDPQHKAALRANAGAAPATKGADTSSGGNRPEGTPPDPKPKDAFDDEVWKQRKAELGI